MGNSPQYTSIQNDNDPAVSSPRRRGAGFVGLGLLFAIAVVAVMGSNPRASNTLREGNLAMEAMAHAPPACTFKECFATKCNAEFAPYNCLFNNGGPHGGCSPTPWILGTCEVQCDLSNCDTLEIPDSVDSCKEVECEKEWCAGSQVCPDNVPYQCTSGSARFGCSMDEFQWTLKTDTPTCPGCCDTNTCN